MVTAGGVVDFQLRYDVRAPSFSRPQADLFQACLDQCEWADSLGFEAVSLQEHHGSDSDDGYNPSPLILAAAIAARTKRIAIRVAALIIPLHDPIRVAEDAAVVDQISRGRLELILGAGYRVSEFQMFGKDLADRVRLQTEAIEVLKQAWSGDPFEYHGHQVRVTPTPFRQPRPPLILGGSSEGAARRAAHIADGFEPTLPHFSQAYESECERLGRPATPARRQGLPAMFLHIAEDPEGAWARIGPHALHEMNSYGRWVSEGDSEALYQPVEDLETLRAMGLYLVVTPDELVERAKDLGPDGVLVFHPLMGGLDPDLAWESLELFEQKVLPRLAAEGLMP
jgi:alkanesulfonate monooxygenase SsuD/methylene tetrahydromethanopterin reductase-like flavin-dependent oxidoreductase (luciferase family)